MTTYRVGEAGATVFDPDGCEVLRLVAGQIVVAGTIDTPGSLAQQTQRLLAGRSGYDDKVIRPARTSPTPPRQPDDRLRNPLAGSG